MVNYGILFNCHPVALMLFYFFKNKMLSFRLISASYIGSRWIDEIVLFSSFIITSIFFFFALTPVKVDFGPISM